jgi:hypothetical protein
MAFSKGRAKSCRLSKVSGTLWNGGVCLRAAGFSPFAGRAQEHRSSLKGNFCSSRFGRAIKRRPGVLIPNGAILRKY